MPPTRHPAMMRCTRQSYRSILTLVDHFVPPVLLLHACLSLRPGLRKHLHWRTVHALCPSLVEWVAATGWTCLSFPSPMWMVIFCFIPFPSGIDILHPIETGTAQCCSPVSLRKCSSNSSPLAIDRLHFGLYPSINPFIHPSIHLFIHSSIPPYFSSSPPGVPGKGLERMVSLCHLLLQRQ